MPLFPCLQRLFSLMPFLQQRMLRMQPKLLAALAADPDRVAARLIELKAMLPAADVAAVVGGRPSLLLEGEWEQVPKRVEQLAAHYTEEEVARLVAVEPLLLVEDIEEVLAELQRCGGSGVGGRQLRGLMKHSWLAGGRAGAGEHCFTRCRCPSAWPASPRAAGSCHSSRRRRRCWRSPRLPPMWAG